MSERSDLVASLAARSIHLRQQGGQRRTSDTHLRRLLDVYGEGWHAAERERDRLASELDEVRKLAMDAQDLAEQRINDLLEAEKSLHDALRKLQLTVDESERLSRRVAELEARIAQLLREEASKPLPREGPCSQVLAGPAR